MQPIFYAIVTSSCLSICKIKKAATHRNCFFFCSPCWTRTSDWRAFLGIDSTHALVSSGNGIFPLDLTGMKIGAKLPSVSGEYRLIDTNLVLSGLCPECASMD